MSRLLSSKKKIIVFDMDETLGHFVEFNMFWTSLKEYLLLNNLSHLIVDNKNNHYNINESTFFKLLDLYPEFIRPNIMSILKYLKIKMDNGDIQKIMIYTNNNGPKEWVISIKDYFNTKIGFPIFDHVIAAFMVNGKIIEPKRTSFFKSYEDLINCAKLSKHTEVCFIDDQYHPHMINDKVYYIYTQPYLIRIEYDEMIKRLIDSKILPLTNFNDFNDFMIYKLKNYSYNVKKSKITEDDYKMSQEIMKYLQTFIKKGVYKHTIKKDKLKLHILDKNKTRKYKPIT